MTGDPSHDESPPSALSDITLIDQICDRFEEAWRKGHSPRIDDYLGSTSEPLRSRLFEELLLSDLEFRTRDEATIDTGEYLSRFPDRATQIRDVIDRFWSEYGVGRSSPREANLVRRIARLPRSPPRNSAAAISCSRKSPAEAWGSCSRPTTRNCNGPSP